MIRSLRTSIIAQSRCWKNCASWCSCSSKTQMSDMNCTYLSNSASSRPQTGYEKFDNRIQNRIFMINCDVVKVQQYEMVRQNSMKVTLLCGKPQKATTVMSGAIDGIVFWQHHLSLLLPPIHPPLCNGASGALVTSQVAG